MGRVGSVIGPGDVALPGCEWLGASGETNRRWDLSELDVGQWDVVGRVAITMIACVREFIRRDYSQVHTCSCQRCL